MFIYLSGHLYQVYQFPECDPDEDAAFQKQDCELKEAVPFAVCGSTQILEVNGKRFRGRVYPWGVVEGTCKNDKFVITVWPFISNDVFILFSKLRVRCTATCRN